MHIHDVDIRNADDCICVKGDNDGSRIWSEDWVVENSTASGEGLSVGTVWSGNFIIRNVSGAMRRAQRGGGIVLCLASLRPSPI